MKLAFSLILLSVLSTGGSGDTDQYDWKKEYWSIETYGTVSIAKKVYQFCNEYDTWLVNARGKKLTPAFRDIGKFSNGLAEFVPHEGYSGLKGLHGYINKKGEIVIPPIYHSAGTFENGKAWVIYPLDSIYGLSFIDTLGSEIHRLPVEEFSDSFLSSRALASYACNKDTREMLMWREGPSSLMLYWEPSEYLIKRSSEKQGITLINYHGKFGFINQNQILQTPVVLDEVDVAGIFSGHGLQRVKYRGQYGFVDKTTGKVAIACQFEDTKSPSLGLFWVKRNGKWGCIDYSGDTKIPFGFDYAGSFSGNGRAAIKIGNLQGHIDTSGKFITPAEYDKTSYFSDGYALVARDGKYGYVDENGKLVIPIRYSEATPFTDGYAEVRLWGSYFRLTMDGETRFKRLSNELILTLCLLVLISVIYLESRLKIFT